MLYKKIQIDHLELLQKNLLPLLPEDAFRLFGVFPQWSDYLLENEEIKQLIDQLNLHDKIDYIAVITMPPNSESPIHIDGDRPECSLNIPLLNCKNTFMNWYSSIQPPKEVKVEDDKTYFGADKDSCTPIASIEMNDPYYVNIKELHNGYNPNDTWRLLLSIRLTTSEL